MHCKNCEYKLESSTKFCSNCGAKVIGKRLTLRNLSHEFSERFLNYDNTLFKAVRHMFTQPEVVIDSFINGTRKKYLNVFNYFALAITITGFFTFIFLKFYPEVFTNAMNVLKASQETEQQKEFFSNFMSGIFDYQSLMYFLMIPLLALISKIVFFNYKKYNYTEHAVIYLYAYSHSVVIINILYLICILTSATLLNYVIIFSIPFSVIYVAYVLKRLYQLSFKKILLKTLLFLVIGIIFYIAIIIIVGIIVIIVMLLDGSFVEMIEQQRQLREK